MIRSGFFAAHTTKALVKAVDSAAGINDLLLTCVERVTGRTDIDVDFFSACGTDLDHVAAAARRGQLTIVGVYFSFHFQLLAASRHPASHLLESGCTREARKAIFWERGFYQKHFGLQIKISMTDGPTRIVRVAVPTPLRRNFDYRITRELENKLLPGCRVRVPFGKRSVTGLVLAVDIASELAIEDLKPVDQLLDTRPLLADNLFRLFLWAADYYQYPVGDALHSVLPSLLRRGQPVPESGDRVWRLSTIGKGLGGDSLRRAKKQRALIDRLLTQGEVEESALLQQFSRPVIRELRDKGLIESGIRNCPAASPESLLRSAALTLSPSQQEAIDRITLYSFRSYLLDGVTGSGKTEVYLQVIEKVLRYGRQALVLVPEISLTPQTQRRFSERFNAEIAVLHSALSDNQRLDAWANARSGRARIVLGTRSAIFTPLHTPGLIIVDEEHDQSYKQQDGFRFSARDLAVIRAKSEQIPLILGSATPSLESLHNCAVDRYTHLKLGDRAGGAVAPDWQLVDLRNVATNEGFARPTEAAIANHLEQGNQVLVFLNRRGFAPALLCHVCGWVAECHRCDSRLTLHRARNLMICHHCDHNEKRPELCPQCGEHQLFPVGEGTERSEDWLRLRFPTIPVVRVDRDTTRQKGSMENVIGTVDNGGPCILIGTQMLAKGHHFPNVTLVVCLNADSGLLSTDFRGHERLGQLLTQVAGRSGRGTKPGVVLLQTHEPGHPVLEYLIERGYAAFAQFLLEQRKQCGLPPYRYMALVRAEANSAAIAETFLSVARKQAELLPVRSQSLEYVGPLPASMERRAGRYRYQLQLTSDSRRQLQSLLKHLALLLEKLPESRRVRWSIDVDPLET